MYVHVFIYMFMEPLENSRQLGAQNKDEVITS